MSNAVGVFQVSIDTKAHGWCGEAGTGERFWTWTGRRVGGPGPGLARRGCRRRDLGDGLEGFSFEYNVNTTWDWRGLVLNTTLSNTM